MLGAGADTIELATPEFGVTLLDRGQPSINFLQSRVRFDIGEGSIQAGAVVFALKVCAIARGVITLGHRSPAQRYTPALYYRENLYQLPRNPDPASS